MIRKVLLLSAVAGSLMLSGQKSAAAALITTQASNTIEVMGTEYNVFFNQDSDGATAFNDVFGGGVADLTFDSPGDADVAVQQILDLIPVEEWLPLNPTPGRAAFFVPYEASSALFATERGRFFRNDLRNLPIEAGLERSTDVLPVFASFATFESVDATPVPTPALLPGLLGLGFSTIRKRKLAQSEEA